MTITTAQAGQQELKPCPFCGSTSIDVHAQFGREWWAQCSNCDACHGVIDNTEAEAIARWNRRAAATPSQAAQEGASQADFVEHTHPEFGRGYFCTEDVFSRLSAPPPAAAAVEAVPPDANDCRIALVVAIDGLISQIENTLYAFRGDAEAVRQAEGAIVHARKVAQPDEATWKPMREPGNTIEHPDPYCGHMKRGVRKAYCARCMRAAFPGVPFDEARRRFAALSEAQPTATVDGVKEGHRG